MLNKGFDNEELQAPLAEINMTPFVDIMLVLLVIFLITAPLIQSSIDLNLPKEIGNNIDKKNPVSISITKDGEYYLEQKRLDFNDLKNHLISIAKDSPNVAILIKADQKVEYGKVASMLSLMQQQGLSNIGFITEK
jgi:biopolymer transport protein ExbD